MLLFTTFYISLFSSSIPFTLSIIPFNNCKQFNQSFLLITFLGAKFIFDSLVFTFQKLFCDSMPIFHFSVLVEFILIFSLLKKIHYYSFFNLFLLIGISSSLIDMSVLSDLHSCNIFSSVINFGLIIVYSGAILRKQNISKRDELFNSTIFLYYIVALTYTVFQKFHVNKTIVNDFAFYFFAFATIAYNLSLTNIVCIMKKK